MKTSWREVELGDHIDLLTGFPFKSAGYLEKPDGAVRLLRGDNVAQGRLRWDGAKHWPEGECAGFSNFELREGDVILAMDRPWIEAGLKYAWVRQSDLPCLLVQRVARIRGANDLNTDYLRYVIGSREFTTHVKAITTGVNVPHISGRDIKRFRFLLPPEDDQVRIASILRAYDDLIELNRRRIGLLEEMARGLFEEWFVHFRYPDHEGNPTVETSNGLIPVGWQWVPLKSLCSPSDGIQTGPFGSQLHQSDYTDEGVPVVMPKNLIGLRVVEAGIARIPEELANQLGRHRMRPGDIVYGRRGDIGRRAYITELEHGWFCGTGCLRLRPDPEKVAPRYLFDALGLPVTDGMIKGRAQGATMPNLSAGVMADVELMAAPLTLQREYVDLVEPLTKILANLEQANIRLASARDLLLPRLISGELSISAAEQNLEAAA
jgi:type I restriction enzyme S subunit